MSIKEEVNKSFGDDIVLSANSVLDTKVMNIPISPSLDIILNGGVPEGSFVIFTGQPKCGKTTTSLYLAGNAQQPEYGYGSFKDGREVYYLNIEGRLKKRDLEGIPHINKDKFHIIGSQQGKILHAEEYLQIAEKLLIKFPDLLLSSIRIQHFAQKQKLHQTWVKCKEQMEQSY